MCEIRECENVCKNELPGYQLQLIDKPCSLVLLLCCSFVRLHYALLRHPWHVKVANLLMGTLTCNKRTIPATTGVTSQ
jgi:hypothetical protein